MESRKSLAVIRNVCRSWKGLVLTTLGFRLLTFCLLSPLFSILIGFCLAMSGNQVLTDIDIAFLLIDPFGLLLGILVGSVWLALRAVEQSALLGVLAANSQGTALSPTQAILFAGQHFWAVLRVAFRFIAVTLVVTAPFLVSVGLLYYFLLGAHDINYYLAEKPPNFLLALGLGTILGLAFAVLLLGLLSSWFLTLPLMLFEKLSPRQSLIVSSAKISGHRQVVFWRLVAWALLIVTAQFLSVWAISMIASWLVPTSIGSLPVLVARAGVMLFILALASAAINVLATITFAAIQFGCYRRFYPDWTTSVGRVQESLQAGNAPQRGRSLGRWVIAMLVAAVLVVIIGFQFLGSLALKDSTLVMAHRGSSFFAPENSLAAIQQAIADGADWVEIDVQETADGEVVVVHDSDLMKLSRNPVKIWDVTMAELQQIDIGSWKSPQFSSERIATLGQVLEACRNRIGVMIELKYYGHDQQLEQRVIELVEQHDMANQVMIMSLKPEGIKKVKTLRPDWKCGVLFSVSTGQLERIDGDFLAVNAKFATRRFIERVHRSGREIYVWTIDEPSMMSTLINRGVDGILTNRPEIARQVLRSRSEMGISERLLTELVSLLRVDRDQVLEDH